jgi:hypothetical protein
MTTDEIPTIQNARYIKMTDEALGIVDQNIAIQCVYHGRNMTITINPRSERYKEIMRQVDAGELTIQDAE